MSTVTGSDCVPLSICTSECRSVMRSPVCMNPTSIPSWRVVLLDVPIWK